LIDMSIEIKNIYKQFGDNKVLEDVSYRMEPGMVNMIIGKSGCGKSVLLKCVVGLITPNSGEILFDGDDFHASDFEKKREIRKNIGMLFQASALFDSLTVNQNVAFPLEMFTRNSKKEIQKRVDFCLERVDLNGVGHLLPSEISGGMKKRVGIARAIAMQPKYLFCDEPNSGLDPLTASLIDKLIQEITHEYEMTTIVVSHDMNSVTNIGDKIMFLSDRKKIWEGSKENLMNSDNEVLNEFVFVSDFMKDKKK
jgi:phospholipid/cholesterol/gamma-HCH transport system ATP-binding protein